MGVSVVWPVWSDSTRTPVRFTRLSKKEAARRWHKARRYDLATHQPGKHGGAIGRPALAVLYSLLFEFLDYATGRLDPSYDAIARKAGVCRRTAVAAIKRLRDLGILAWRRRCAEGTDAGGRFQLRQETNAYEVLPPSEWVNPPAEPPPPEPWQLGIPDPILTGADAAVAARIAGGSTEEAVQHLLDSADPAQAAMGRFLQSLMEGDDDRDDR